MDRSLSYLEMSMRERQQRLIDEGRRIAQVRLARSDVRTVHAGTPARDRTLLTTVARPGVSLALQPRPAAQFAADCAERVAGWRRAAARVGRSLVTVGRRLEQVGRAA